MSVFVPHKRQLVIPSLEVKINLKRSRPFPPRHCVFSKVWASSVGFDSLKHWNMTLTHGLRFFASITYALSIAFSTGAGKSVIRTSPSSIGSILVSSNRSVILDRLPIENALDIRCDGAQYGFNLNIAECKGAKSYIASGSEQLPWVERQTRFSKAHFALPYRYMDGKYRSP